MKKILLALAVIFTATSANASTPIDRWFNKQNADNKHLACVASMSLYRDWSIAYKKLPPFQNYELVTQYQNVFLLKKHVHYKDIDEAKIAIMNTPDSVGFVKALVRKCSEMM